MRIALSRISKRKIRIDDTADLACGHGLSKNNGEDRGRGRVRLKGQEEFRNRVVGRARWRASARFVSLFVSTRVCTKGIYLKGRKRGWRQRRTTSCHPEKNPRDSAVFCERTLRARNSIAAGKPDENDFLFHEEPCRLSRNRPPRPIGMHASCNSKE